MKWISLTRHLLIIVVGVLTGLMMAAHLMEHEIFTDYTRGLTKADAVHMAKDSDYETLLNRFDGLFYEVNGPESNARVDDLSYCFFLSDDFHAVFLTSSGAVEGRITAVFLERYGSKDSYCIHFDQRSFGVDDVSSTGFVLSDGDGKKRYFRKMDFQSDVLSGNYHFTDIEISFQEDYAVIDGQPIHFHVFGNRYLVMDCKLFSSYPFYGFQRQRNGDLMLMPIIYNSAYMKYVTPEADSGYLLEVIPNE